MDPSQISPNQRIIVPDHVIPREQQTRTALDEDIIADHLEKFLLAEDNDAQCKVFSDPFGGCHVYCFPPSETLKRNYWTLVSMGMSGTKMNVPADLVGAEDYQYAEVRFRGYGCDLLNRASRTRHVGDVLFASALGNAADLRCKPNHE